MMIKGRIALIEGTMLLLEEGYCHTSSNNIQRTLHTLDIHPACDQLVISTLINN